jgi:hypothetical protein
VFMVISFEKVISNQRHDITGQIEAHEHKHLCEDKITHVHERESHCGSSGVFYFGVNQ